LVSAGLRCVLIANRTYDRAVSLAQSLGAARASAVHFDALPASLTDADIVICSTGAPHVVLHVEQVALAMLARPQRPLLVADLAVPRDADPAIAALPNVSLTHLDGLERLAQERYPVAASTLQAVGLIIDQVAGEYWAWYEARRSAPLIQALRHKAGAICAVEVRYTLRRLEGLTPTQQQAVEAMAQAIVNKLLHDPISAMKEAGGSQNEDFLAWIEDLYGLDLHGLDLSGLPTPEAN
jgi:glutamyl-tRNA reductase